MILGVALSIVALCTWLAGRLATRMVRPIRTLAATASAVAAGQMTARAPEAGPPEVAETARALNAMLDVNAGSSRILASTSTRWSDRPGSSRRSRR